LEQYIEQLLHRFSVLQAEKKRLESDLQRANDDNRQLRQQLDALHGERGDIRTRVTSLIERIERWEAETEDLPDTADAEDHAPASEQETAQDGDPEEEAEPEPTAARKAERDGGVQGSLFPR
jgi:chromosome segregation ATPase